jgi:hypothetical protein
VNKTVGVVTLVETKTLSVEQAQVTSLLQVNNSEREGFDEENLPIQSSLATATIEGTKGHIGNAEVTKIINMTKVARSVRSASHRLTTKTTGYTKA